MVKIKTYKVNRRGQSGFVLSVPKVWIDDWRVEAGDVIDVYRGNCNEANMLDVLILKVKRKE